MALMASQRQERVARGARCRSVRESKDPSAFESMDELRDYLHKKEPNKFTLSNAIHFMGQAMNKADMAAPEQATSTSDSTSSASPVPVLPALLYRGLAKGYRDFVRVAGAAIRHRLNPYDASDEESKWPQVDPEKYKELEPLMGGLLSLRSLRKAAYKHPALLEMPPAELAVRMVTLKQLLSGCDVALLVEEEPALFLGGSREEVEAQVQKGMGLMERGLAGANLFEVVMRDPRLIFMPELEKGIRELRDLWDVDEDALGNSDPQMLALAVRALSITGLPKGL